MTEPASLNFEVVTTMPPNHLDGNGKLDVMRVSGDETPDLSVRRQFYKSHHE